MTLGERIKKVRKALDLTQREFGERIAMRQNSVAQVEMGRGTSDQTIFAICREFNVNENWLRTGEGGEAAMFVQRSRDDELSAFVDELMHEQPQDFRRRLVTALSRLKPEQWDALEAVALSLMDDPGPSGGDSEPSQKTKLYIAARDGSRIETEVDGDLTLPEEDTPFPR
ncbi:MAG: helix-turn-helix transcriptional regulator [Clostridiales bacterium]|nr:helix-turn-helix transcriptional regulator [Clostridiales bacterium]